ncbi:MAG: histidine kinase [Bacteroidota bacterium]
MSNHFSDVYTMLSLNSTSKLLIACSFCMCYGGHLFSQIDWSSPILSIDERDGLPSTYIRNFVEDEWGFIWLSSFKSVCRFDGSQLEVLNSEELPSEGYSEIAYDKRRKVLWIGHFTGLYSYHIPTGKVGKHTHSAAAGHNQIQSISLDSEGGVWVVARSRFARLAPSEDSLETIHVKLPGVLESSANELFHIRVDPVKENRIWIASQAGLLTYNTSTGEFQNAHEWLNPSTLQSVREIAVSPFSQRIYVGFLGAPDLSNDQTHYNYAVFDSEQDAFIDAFSIDRSWANSSICAWKDSTMLLSSSNGLAFYDEASEELVQVLQNEATRGQTYRADFVDSQKNIWAFTVEGIKVYRTANQAVESHFYPTDNPGWYHIPIDLHYDRKENSLFMAVIGGEGLYQFPLEDNKWKLYPYKDGEGKVKKTSFSHITRSRNRSLTVVGLRGIYEVSNSGEVKEISQREEYVISGGQSYWDSQGILWTTRGNEVFTFHPKQQLRKEITEFTHFCESYSGESHYLEDSKTNIWIGGFCGGFDRYDRKTDTFQSFEIGPQVEGVSVTSFNEYGDYIWVQSETGDIYKIETAAPEKGIVQTIKLFEGIQEGEIISRGQIPNPQGYFRSGEMDRWGRLWFFTDNGLFGFDPENSEVIGFDESVGLPLRDLDLKVFTATLITQLPDGRMAFATRKGIGIFDPRILILPAALPTPYIRNLLVNNEPVVSDSSAFFATQYRLGPRENFLGIDFSSVDFHNPSGVSYLYKLEEVDEEWKDPGDRRFISYSEVKGGDYTFRLKAANSSGNWSPREAVFHVHIDKFWYQTLWAKILFVLTGMGLIAGIYFYRLRQAIKKEQEKNKYEKNLAEIKMQALTAQMNPHFIFNSLNSIDFYIIKNNTKKASKYLNSFSRLMRLILSNSRSNYVSLADDLEALKLYLEIEALRFNHRFSYEVTLDDTIDVDFLEIPPMLIQPYVENSIWHGLLHKKDNGKITIHYRYDEAEEVLTCTVEDNGIGRKKSMELKTQKESDRGRKSFGMNITKDKIEAMKFLHGIDAKVEVKDLYDPQENSMGTKVELMIPV